MSESVNSESEVEWEDVEPLVGAPDRSIVSRYSWGRG